MPPSAGLGAFYQIVEAGFDRQVPTQPIARGLEIYREFVDSEANRRRYWARSLLGWPRLASAQPWESWFDHTCTLRVDTTAQRSPLRSTS